MPAPPLTNNFETQIADGTVITTANSDDGTPSAGDAFSAITGSPTFSTTQAHLGTLSMRIDTTGTYAETHAAWTGLGSITTSVWFRAYVYLTAFPVATVLRLFTARTAANANSGFLSMTTAGKLQGLNAAQSGTGQTIATVAIALDQWVRIEWRVVSSATVGELEWWLYNNPEAPIGSYTDHQIGTGLVLGANTDGIRWGPSTVTGPANFVYYTDDVAVSTVAQIGGQPLAPTPIAWVAA